MTTTGTTGIHEIKEFLRLPYSRNLILQEDGTYFAEILEFPSCFAQGATPTEALDLLEKVARGWLEVALRKGKTIPPPIQADYSGRLVLRLPKDLHRQAAIFAQRNGVSLNQFISTAVQASVGAFSVYSHVADMTFQLFFPHSPAATGGVKTTPGSSSGPGVSQRVMETGTEIINSQFKLGTNFGGQENA